MRGATRRLAVAGCGLAMLAGAYAGYWFILAGALEHGALAWIEDRQRQGDDIRHSSPTRRGFPGRVEIVLPKPAFTVQAASRTIAAAGARAVLSVDPLAPQRLTLSLQGEQTVELSGLRRPLHYVGEAEQFDLEVGLRLALRDWSVVALPTPATLTVRSLTMIDDRTGDHFAVAALDAVASRLPEAAAGRHYTLAAGDVTLPASLDFPFGGVLTRTVVDLVVSGSLPAVPTGDDIIVWREAGGVIDVRQFELATGPIRLEGEGTLALDSSGQPIGAMTIEITGYHAALDTLIVRGIIAVTTGLRLKQIFAVLAGGSVNPNKSVRIPLTLQERVLSAGPIPLIELPFVAW